MPESALMYCLRYIYLSRRRYKRMPVKAHIKHTREDGAMATSRR